MGAAAEVTNGESVTQVGSSTAKANAGPNAPKVGSSTASANTGPNTDPKAPKPSPPPTCSRSSGCFHAFQSFGPKVPSQPSSSESPAPKAASTQPSDRNKPKTGVPNISSALPSGVAAPTAPTGPPAVGAATAPPSDGAPAAVPRLPDDAWPASISEIMNRAIECRAFPGGAVAVGTCTQPVFEAAYGHYTYDVRNPIDCSESVWDLASLTKVMVTVPSIMILFERNLVELDAPVCRYVPSFAANGKQGVTVRMLLTHTGGLREWHPFFALGLRTKQQVLDFILLDRLWHPPGMAARYSDLSMIVLGLVVEAVAGCSLATFAQRNIFGPLGMSRTGFRYITETPFSAHVVPTEFDPLHRQRLLWGEVHDPTAWIMGGEAGHAGLFSTLGDVVKFAQSMLAGGIDLSTRHRILLSSTVRKFTAPTPPTPENQRPFALGWDLACRRGKTGYTSAGSHMGPRTFGHTGYTGTSLWMDPDQNLFVLLLTNSVHPTACTDSGNLIQAVRPLIADAAVHVMGHLAGKRDVLTWHLGDQGSDDDAHGWTGQLQELLQQILHPREAQPILHSREAQQILHSREAQPILHSREAQPILQSKEAQMWSRVPSTKLNAGQSSTAQGGIFEGDALKYQAGAIFEGDASQGQAAASAPSPATKPAIAGEALRVSQLVTPVTGSWDSQEPVSCQDTEQMRLLSERAGFRMESRTNANPAEPVKLFLLPQTSFGITAATEEHELARPIHAQGSSELSCSPCGELELELEIHGSPSIDESYDNAIITARSAAATSFARQLQVALHHQECSAQQCKGQPTLPEQAMPLSRPGNFGTSGSLSLPLTQGTQMPSLGDSLMTEKFRQSAECVGEPVVGTSSTMGSLNQLRPTGESVGKREHNMGLWSLALAGGMLAAVIIRK